MPTQIDDIKLFIEFCRSGDTKGIRIKKSGNQYKFKVRRSGKLYTLTVSDPDKAEKLRRSLPPGLNTVSLPEN